MQMFPSDQGTVPWKVLNQLQNSQYSCLRAIIREAYFLQYLFSSYSWFAYIICILLPFSAGFLTSSLITFPSSTIHHLDGLILNLWTLKYINLVLSLGFYRSSLLESSFPRLSLGYFLQPQFKYQLFKEVSCKKTGYSSYCLYLNNVLVHYPVVFVQLNIIWNYFITLWVFYRIYH